MTNLGIRLRGFGSGYSGAAVLSKFVANRLVLCSGKWGSSSIKFQPFMMEGGKHYGEIWLGEFAGAKWVIFLNVISFTVTQLCEVLLKFAVSRNFSAFLFQLFLLSSGRVSTEKQPVFNEILWWVVLLNGPKLEWKKLLRNFVYSLTDVRALHSFSPFPRSYFTVSFLTISFFTYLFVPLSFTLSCFYTSFFHYSRILYLFFCLNFSVIFSIPLNFL